ncbi:hypothetical protein chiPu_0004518 [Chiloscyllium punctatum]|uniref:Uncharacterized protein n=1 Tax=Chiloscyllium punctatum TaxID=137246 RepID=A0A401S6T8_CHIPU|nr:hypothetical protein [Chiloscyllium punctatum]
MNRFSFGFQFIFPKKKLLTICGFGSACFRDSGRYLRRDERFTETACVFGFTLSVSPKRIDHSAHRGKPSNL